MPDRTLALDADALRAFIARDFPQVSDDLVIEQVSPMRARVRMKMRDIHLRPGGTVSGPTMFALADIGVYVAILAMVGEVPLAVTTGASIDFMRKPAAGQDIVADVVLHKLGRVLAVGDALVYSAGAAGQDATGQDAPVARATMTYSIPPARNTG